MRICRFSYQGGIEYAVINQKRVLGIGNPFEEGKINYRGIEYSMSKIKLLAPCTPSKVVAVGLNYIDHAEELKMAIPEEPILFLKPPSSVIGPEEEIVIPQISERVDYEAELVIVLSKKAKDIDVDSADDYILGYACGNDVTARDLQKKDGQWTRSKSFDSFCPLGPWVETEVDPSNLDIKLLLNGNVKQESNTNQMIFNCHELVSFVSRVMTLLPGDVIMTGTPPGVGQLKLDDKVEVQIEQIASLVNRVVSNQ